MMKIKNLFIVLLVSLSCDGNKVKNNLEPEVLYYANIAGIISPFIEYKGRGALSFEEAKEKKHYRFHYLAGEIQSIQYFNGEEPLNGSYFGTHQVKYKIDQKRIERSYWDLEGNKSTMWRHYYLGEQIHREMFELDEYSQKKSLTLFDTLNVQIPSGLGAYKFEIQYVDENTFIQRQFNKSDKPIVLTPYFPFQISKITVGEDGFLQSIFNLNSSYSLVLLDSIGYSQVLFDFDSLGNELGWSFHDNNGNLVNRKSLKNMDYGFARVEYQFDWISRAKGLYRSFDEMYFDESDMPVSNNFGIHKIAYSFDRNDNMTSISFYDVSGAIEHPVYGYHSIIYEYDDQGKGTLKSKLDKSLKLME